MNIDGKKCPRPTVLLGALCTLYAHSAPTITFGSVYYLALGGLTGWFVFTKKLLEAKKVDNYFVLKLEQTSY